MTRTIHCGACGKEGHARNHCPESAKIFEGLKNPTKCSRSNIPWLFLLGLAAMPLILSVGANRSKPPRGFYCNDKKMSEHDWCGQRCAVVDYEDNMRVCPNLRHGRDANETTV